MIEQQLQADADFVIAPQNHPTHGTTVRCRDRLGGLLRYYHHAA